MVLIGLEFLFNIYFIVIIQTTKSKIILVFSRRINTIKDKAPNMLTLYKKGIQNKYYVNLYDL